MTKLDLAAADTAYYNPPREPVTIELHDIPYLSVRGRGAPGGAEHAAATAALYTLAYAVKFEAKAAGTDFTVAKLEGQWWWDDKYIGKGPTEVPREEWEWRLLLRQPDFVSEAMVAAGRAKAAAKKPAVPKLETVLFEKISEGLCVQVMHHGPFADEDKTIALVHEYMHAHGLTHNGWHHELYITDMRKTPQEKARTILRQPVRKL